jgi:hypothetical protein
LSTRTIPKYKLVRPWLTIVCVKNITVKFPKKQNIKNAILDEIEFCIQIRTCSFVLLCHAHERHTPNLSDATFWSLTGLLYLAQNSKGVERAMMANFRFSPRDTVFAHSATNTEPTSHRRHPYHSRSHDHHTEVSIFLGFPSCPEC